MSGTEGLARMILNDPTFVVAVTDLQLNNIGLIERVVALCRKKGYHGSQVNGGGHFPPAAGNCPNIHRDPSCATETGRAIV